MIVSSAAGQIAAAPEQGDFVFARGKSWIVERAEKIGPVQTLHLVSCEDESQGETIQLAFATELQTQVLDPNDWSPLLNKSFEGPQRLGAYLRSTEWRTATAADRKLFQSPFRAGMRSKQPRAAPEQIDLFGPSEEEIRKQAEREMRQFEADRRSWDGKLLRLQNELDSEPEKVRRGYEVQARRLELVGLVYLWPATN